MACPSLLPIGALPYAGPEQTLGGAILPQCRTEHTETACSARSKGTCAQLHCRTTRSSNYITANLSVLKVPENHAGICTAGSDISYRWSTCTFSNRQKRTAFHCLPIYRFRHKTTLSDSSHRHVLNQIGSFPSNYCAFFCFLREEITIKMDNANSTRQMGLVKGI